IRSRSSSCVMLTPSFASAAWAWFKKPVAASQSATDDLVRIFRVIALNVTDPHEAGSNQNPGGLLPKWHVPQKGRTSLRARRERRKKATSSRESESLPARAERRALPTLVWVTRPRHRPRGGGPPACRKAGHP